MRRAAICEWHQKLDGHGADWQKPQQNRFDLEVLEAVLAFSACLRNLLGIPQPFPQAAAPLAGSHGAMAQQIERR